MQVTLAVLCFDQAGNRVIVHVRQCVKDEETFERKSGYLFKEFNRSYFGARLYNVSPEQANSWRLLYANMAGAHTLKLVMNLSLCR
jgi:hypothetical protein